MLWEVGVVSAGKFFPEASPRAHFRLERKKHFLAAETAK